ncbi:Putative DNA binding protein [Neisseria meningitidis]|nr:Putative DNA binding protein [Neisseria meningitidis]
MPKYISRTVFFTQNKRRRHELHGTRVKVKEVAEKLGVSENFVWAKTDRGNVRHDPTFPGRLN